MRRRLHGRRGLKWVLPVPPRGAEESPPSRAAWIEMRTSRPVRATPSRRRLHGRRGLKCAKSQIFHFIYRRRLHGRRGLKYEHYIDDSCAKESPPSRAAWIEIRVRQAADIYLWRRRLHGRRGLKFLGVWDFPFPFESPPSRAAWIEIVAATVQQNFGMVAAFTGGVD